MIERTPDGASAGGTPPTTRGLRAWVGLCAILAFVRVGALALSLPFFSHIDEASHVDALFKYARGALPAAGADAYELELVELFALYNSGEYLAARFGDLPLPAAIDGELRERYLAIQRDVLAAKPNHEAFQPPTYFVLAAAVWHAGRAAGLAPITALYLVRLLGAVILALTVVTSCALARRLAPDRRWLWFATPWLVAWFPQDVLALVNSDVPLVLLFPLALLTLLRALDDPRRRGRQVAAGLCCAALVLTKATAAPLGAVLAIAAAAVVRGRRIPLRSLWPLALAAGVPAAAWFGYALAATGELTGSHHKVAVLGFQPQTWEGLVSHPLFTLHGLGEFFGTLLPSFWRGDGFWHGTLLRTPAADAAYLVTSVLFLAAAALGRLLPGTQPPALSPAVRRAIWLSLAACLAMHVGLSLGWQFEGNAYPSPEFPYFANGRLSLGVAAPVVVLWLDGAERLCRALGSRRLVLAVVAAMTAVMVASEAWLTAPVAASPNNFWHWRY